MLNAKSLGLTLGILWGVSLFLITIICVLTGGYGSEVLNLIKGVYLGYEITFVGSIIGLIYGFIEGFIGGFLVGWIYNKIEK